MSFFFLFSSTKSENRRAEQVLPRVGVGSSGKEEVAGKGGRRVNIVQKMCTHVCKCKNETWTVETIPGMGEDVDKREWWRA
jgi:hypothetical protein